MSAKAGLKFASQTVIAARRFAQCPMTKASHEFGREAPKSVQQNRWIFRAIYDFIGYLDRFVFQSSRLIIL